MKGSIKNNLIKKIIFILILLIAVYIALGTFNLTAIKSYAATYTYNSTTNDLPANFDSLYPGYRTLIQTVIAEHPTWTIKLLDTGLVWDDVIANETTHGKNLAPKTYSSDWLCAVCGDTLYDTDSWRCASETAVSYMIDPRNSLNSNDLFQFLLLANDTNITKEQVAAMASKISYLNNQTIIDAIYSVSVNYNINPFYIIAKILQEQGSNGSVLCSGNGYLGQYVGYYNFFNIGATGAGTGDVILNGLKYAYDHGWDTPEKSILGGTTTIRNYIGRGQNTTYFQKYNVVYTSSLYNLQYATNVLDGYSVGLNLKSTYINSGLLESNFTFTIPLYYGMSNNNELVKLNATELRLRKTPTDTTSNTYLYSNDVFVRLEKATTKTDGMYFDKVITKKGTGYMARAPGDESKLYLVPIYTPVPIDVGSNNNYSAPDTNSIIKTEPNTTVGKLKETYTGAIIVDKSGAEIPDGTLIGTGAKIKIDGIDAYTIVKLGDVSEDGNITASDYVKVKNNIMGTNSLSDIQRKAADVNSDNNITASDYVKIKNHIMSFSRISI